MKWCIDGGDFFVVKQLKKFEKMKNNPRNVTLKDLISVLEYFNCIVDKSRGKGGHVMVSHPLADRSFPIPSDKPVKAIYVKDCIKFIEEVRELEK